MNSATHPWFACHPWRWLLLPLAALLLVGCWDRIEVNDLAIVSAVALDAASQGRIRVTLQIVVPTRASPRGGSISGGGAESGIPAVQVASAEGRTVDEALGRLQTQQSRLLFFAHMRFLLLGEAFARGGDVRTALDYFTRNRQTRLVIYVLAARSLAAPLLQVALPLDRIPAENVYKTERRGRATATPLYQLMMMLRGQGHDPLLPILTVAQGASGPLSAASLALRGSAVFRGAHLVGWLDDDATRGALWLNGELGHAVTVVKAPDGRPVSLLLDEVRTRRRVAPVGGAPRVQVAIDVGAAISEAPSGLNLSSPSVLESLASAFAASIRQQIDAALAGARSLHADIFGFGELTHEYAPALWRPLAAGWHDEFPQLPVDVTIRAHVRRSANTYSNPATARP